MLGWKLVFRKSKISKVSENNFHHENFFMSFLAELAHYKTFEPNFFWGWSEKIRKFLGVPKGDPPETAIFEGPPRAPENCRIFFLA